MMYSYLEFNDETLVTHSQILNKNGKDSVEVHFERPSDDGFASARCVLPEYEWKFNDGFSDKEIAFFKEFLENNAHLLFRYAAQGGIKIA